MLLILLFSLSKLPNYKHFCLDLVFFISPVKPNYFYIDVRIFPEKIALLVCF